MPFLEDINISALSGNTPEEKLDSLVKQLNEWAREISNEKVTTVQKDESGNTRIVQGSQRYGDQVVVGTLYIDEDGTRNIIVGTLPDGTTGLVITKSGEDVLDVFS